MVFLNKIYLISDMPDKYCDLIYYSQEKKICFIPTFTVAGNRPKTCDAVLACSPFDLRSRVFVHHLTLDLWTCLITAIVKGY